MNSGNDGEVDVGDGKCVLSVLGSDLDERPVILAVSWCEGYCNGNPMIFFFFVRKDAFLG